MSQKPRAGIMAMLLGLFCGLAVAGAQAQTGQSPVACDTVGLSELEQAAHRQAIEYLRRQYALATDLIGMGGPDELQRAQVIYRRIFTADANIRVVIDGQVTRQASSPDGWVQQVQQALQPYAGVQHLIGSQLVELACPADAAAPLEASMSSYLQAWHDRPGEDAYLFIGTYIDRVKQVPGIGWQIHDMELQRVSSARIKH